METINQIYCTHCTYGSSALERREGDLADRVLGYSARSGSLETAELRKSYRQIERFLSYYLPVDTPPEEKLRLDASLAPKRLVFQPSLGGLQMLGQICYRQRDTADRPGSYFGHVLLSTRATHPWPVLSCLTLWGTNWTDQDSATLPFVLPVLESLAELWDGAAPFIGDALLLCFLQTPPGDSFHDPGEVIPQRWKLAPVGDRIALLTDVLQAFLEFGGSGRESIILVVEPALAALLFYGVARLLPQSLRESISFSTFEPNTDRVSVALAATTFHSPETSDLRPEAYRGRSFVHNTFLNKTSERPRAGGIYAGLIIKRLLTHGWNDVDLLLEGMGAAGAAKAQDLEELARIQQSAALLLDPTAPIPSVKLSKVAAAYLRESVLQRLANEGRESHVLQRLRDTPRQFQVLELIATNADNPVGQRAVHALLAQLDEASYPALVASEYIDARFKVTALSLFVIDHRGFPDQCEALWQAASSGKRAASKNCPESVLIDVLQALPVDLLDEQARRLPGVYQESFLLALIRLCRRGGQPGPRSVLTRLVERIPDERLSSFLENHANELAADGYPRCEPALGKRLTRWYEGLGESEPCFSQRLDLLNRWKDYTDDRAEIETRLVHWLRLRDDLLALPNPMQIEQPKVDYDVLGKRLGDHLKNAWPPKTTQKGGRLPAAGGLASLDAILGGGAEKIDCLRSIGSDLLGGREFLPQHIWSKLDAYFRGEHWVSAKQFAQRKEPAKRRLLGVLSVTGGLIVAAGLVLSRRAPPIEDEPSPLENTASNDGSSKPNEPQARSKGLLEDGPKNATLTTVEPTLVTGAKPQPTAGPELADDTPPESPPDEPKVTSVPSKPVGRLAKQSQEPTDSSPSPEPGTTGGHSEPAGEPGKPSKQASAAQPTAGPPGAPPLAKQDKSSDAPDAADKSSEPPGTPKNDSRGGNDEADKPDTKNQAQWLYFEILKPDAKKPSKLSLPKDVYGKIADLKLHFKKPAGLTSSPGRATDRSHPLALDIKTTDSNIFGRFGVHTENKQNNNEQWLQFSWSGKIPPSQEQSLRCCILEIVSSNGTCYVGLFEPVRTNINNDGEIELTDKPNDFETSPFAKLELTLGPGNATVNVDGKDYEALFSGDKSDLRYFGEPMGAAVHVEVTQTSNRWKFKLVPTDPGMSVTLKKLNVTLFRELDGIRQECVIIGDSPAPSAPVAEVGGKQF